MKPFRQRSILVSLIAFMLPSLSAADDVTGRFAKAVFQSDSGESLPYRLLSPANIEPDATYPLLLWLHGAGERGEENERQLVHVVGELASEPLFSRYPAFVLVPQCPKGEKWADVDWSAEQHTMTPDPSRPMKLVLQLLEEVCKTCPIDPERIVVGGLSMGGFGTWDLLQREPDRFAAAIPICGGGDPALAQRIVKIPVWVFHGGDDFIVKTHRSREMVEALRAAGGTPLYTEYPGVGHDSWTMTARNRLVWDWLFAQRRDRRD